MDRIGAALEREGHVLETLLFKLVETRLLLESGETRFLSRATREVERARIRAREADLMRAAVVTEVRSGATLRSLAAGAPDPWPAILRDHHTLLANLVAEIEVTAHRNSAEARAGLEALHTSRVPEAVPSLVAAGSPALPSDEEAEDPELAYLARGAAYEAVLGTAARLRMPDLLDFLR